jgi:hypothetical protein
MRHIATLRIAILIIVVLFEVSSVLQAGTNVGATVRSSSRLSRATPIFAAAATSSTAPFNPRRTVTVCKSACDYNSLRESLANAQDWDLIQVEAGTYADCVVTPANIPHLWIRGTGGMVHMKGVVCEHKGAFVLNGNQTVIENFEFSDLRTACEAGQNAVGIRLQAGDLVLRNSYFHDSQGGILTANNGSSNITISNSHFARLGVGITKCESNPFTWFHNLYIGTVASLTLRNSIIENNRTGNLIKSRAQQR